MEISQYIKERGLKSPEYLGDGVYAAHEEYQVWLLTQRSGGGIDAIALNDDTLASLRRYTDKWSEGEA